MRDDQAQTPAKAPFEPPRLIAIDLAAGEVLGNACRLDAQIADHDANPCMISTCLSNGS